MASNIQGPGIYLAQFAGDAAPFNSWPAITKWAASLGFKGVQVPSWDARLFDLAFRPESENANYARHLDSSSGVAVFVGERSDPEHWVAVGRACQRFALQAALASSAAISSSIR